MKQSITLATLLFLSLSNVYASENECLETINESNTPSEQVWKLEEQIDFHGSLSVGTIFYDKSQYGGRADAPGCALDHKSTRNKPLKAGSKLQVSIKYQPRKEEFWCKAENSKDMTNQELIKFCRNYVEEFKAEEFLENYKFKRIIKNLQQENSFTLVYEGEKHVYVEIKNVDGVPGFSCWDSLKTYDDLRKSLPVSGVKCPSSSK